MICDFCSWKDRAKACPIVCIIFQPQVHSLRVFIVGWVDSDCPLSGKGLEAGEICGMSFSTVLL